MHSYSYSHIGCIMDSVLAVSAVDRGLNPRSGQTIDYNIGIRCFFGYHVSLRNKIKD